MDAKRASAPIIAAAVALAVLSGGGPAAAAPAAFRVYQLNMCMTGSPHYVKDNAKKGQTGAVTCFPNTYVSKDRKGKLHYKKGFAARERKIAGQKRQAVINQVKRYRPTAVTLNEVCTGDLSKIVKRLRPAGYSYTYKAHGIGKGHSSTSLKCSAKRGSSADAIIAHGFVSGSKQGGYYEKNGYRAWLCARVGSGHVRVCTTHLSLRTQHWGGHYHQPVECAKLRKILKSTSRKTVFGGDVNLKAAKKNCAPSTYWGLQDVDTSASARTPRSGLQHVYYSPDYTRGRSCGTVHTVPHTDHKGFLLDLKGTAKRTRGKACAWRDVTR